MDCKNPGNKKSSVSINGLAGIAGSINAYFQFWMVSTSQNRPFITSGNACNGGRILPFGHCLPAISTKRPFGLYYSCSIRLSFLSFGAYFSKPVY
jgi:hypothetical protein